MMMIIIIIIAIWKFYHKLMNNQLPMFFSSMTPQLPVACARYELRNPKSHLPTIKHKYAENSIRYCLISQLNSEVTWASTVEIKTNMVLTTPYPRFKTLNRNKIIDDSYKEHCVKNGGLVCLYETETYLELICNLIESLRISLNTGIH